MRSHCQLVRDTLGAVAVLVVLSAQVGCSKSDVSPTASPVFESVPARFSGITFRNDLHANSRQNVFSYMYFYNGAGVGTGDFDGDGLADLFFASNQASSRVYRNRGGLRFEDVTKVSGIALDSVWSTGVSVADVDADGRPDVLLSVVGPVSASLPHYRWFRNVSERPGEIRFVERAGAVGLDLAGYGSQVAWLDYDRDGDLDAYVLRHSVHERGTFGARQTLAGRRDSLAGDLLLRNDNGHFVDATLEAGIASSSLGYGLGVTTADFNRDGWEDIYVANDFHEDDFLYLNDGLGGFREVGRQSLRHTSRYSMGVDAGDLNGDLFPDIVVLDMLPDDPQILKASAAEDPYNVWNMKLRNGYAPQYSRNVLQISRGLSPIDSSLPLFADVALQAGVHATDWSWSALTKDFDLDGRTDLFITNGILGRSNDLDYINFVTTDENQAELKDRFITQTDLEIADRMPVIRLPNRLYRGRGAGRFSHDSIAVGPAGFSHGASAVDLDNDGDLDVVTSDVNGEAQLLRNLTADRGRAWIGVELLSGAYPDGRIEQPIGAEVYLCRGDEILAYERVQPVRGFLSTSDWRLSFGDIEKAPPGDYDLLIRWPSGGLQLVNVAVTNTYLQIAPGATSDEERAVLWKRIRKSPNDPRMMYQTVAAEMLGIDFVHRENSYAEFDAQALLPHMTSEDGPALAVGDLDGDGLDDLYLGGARGQAGAAFRQNPMGRFESMDNDVFTTDARFEDVEATASDVDGDGDLDLVVASGGSEAATDAELHRPRLYRNNGRGQFSRDESSLPADVALVTGAMLAVDWDRDGDADLCLFPRTQTRRYGRRDNRGYVLINDGSGRFTDRTAELAPAFLQLGMVTRAVVLNRETNSAIVLAEDWGPVTAYALDAGRLGKAERLAPDNLYSGLDVADVNGDGREDLILGALGHNSKLAARGDSSIYLYVGDLDQNGAAEQLVTLRHDGTERLFATRDEISKQVVAFRKRFPSYASFSQASFADFVSPSDRERLSRVEVQETGSAVAYQLPKGRFRIERLPSAAQVAPVSASATLDNRCLMFGNLSSVNVQRGYYDASYGLVLTPGGRIVDRPADSGVIVTGDVKRARHIRIASRSALVLARNGDSPVIIFGQGADEDATPLQ